MPSVQPLLLAPGGVPIARWRPGALPGDPRALGEASAHLHPVWTPAGVPVTALAPGDHRHHRGLFLAWVEARTADRAADWWGWGARAPIGGVVHDAVRLDEGAEGVVLSARSRWQAADGTDVLAVDERITARAARGCHVIDLEASVSACGEPVRLGVSAFSGLALRGWGQAAMTVHGPDGVIAREDAVYDRVESNWPDAPWLAATWGGEQPRGAAIIGDAANPPTTWHAARGIHLLNPSITAAGPVEIGREAMRLRWRVAVWDGDAVDAGMLDRLRADWLAPLRGCGAIHRWRVRRGCEREHAETIAAIVRCEREEAPEVLLNLVLGPAADGSFAEVQWYRDARSARGFAGRVAAEVPRLARLWERHQAQQEPGSASSEWFDEAAAPADVFARAGAPLGPDRGAPWA